MVGARAVVVGAPARAAAKFVSGVRAVAEGLVRFSPVVSTSQFY